MGDNALGVNRFRFQNKEKQCSWQLHATMQPCRLPPHAHSDEVPLSGLSPAPLSPWMWSSGDTCCCCSAVPHDICGNAAIQFWLPMCCVTAIQLLEQCSSSRIPPLPPSRSATACLHVLVVAAEVCCASHQSSVRVMTVLKCWTSDCRVLFLGSDCDELAKPAHFTVLEITSRNQRSELSSATMIPRWRGSGSDT